ncbi:hypothetical protein RxyAA322_19090 [Rubrobacter xylanophilus]|uniref:AI-2E family transporter n=1 Tax=Rubrobacter xylanophilus TaxID=49319 RepID=A0A510HL54_9ACTN|nr:hypothetical protein RxyAA322_19090 [Rubrobacter xylanophilus]
MRVRDGVTGWRRLLEGAPLAVLLAAGLLVGYALLPVLELVAISMLLALVLRTVIWGMGRVGVPGWAAVLLLLLLFGLFGALFWLVLLPNILGELQTLASQLPGYLESLVGLSRRLNEDFGFVPDLSELSGRARGLASRLFGMLPELAGGMARAAADAVIVVFLALYLARDPGPVVSGFLRLFPEEERGRVSALLGRLEVRLRGWMVGAGLAALIVGTGAGVGLWALGVPLPITFGLLAALLNFIPYFGSVVAAVLPVLVALTISPLKALLVAALYVVLNQIEGNVVQPLVMGREVSLHPVWILVSFLALGTLLGFAGLLLAVPAAVALATVLDELLPKAT